ncbi:MAG: 6,7-dimethyl-8-ribityllumazine synthase [Dehalococcoidales bacterium]|jgi:6,7-dimethyl-8-ribityllumazine synthase|nr:6,7-dimethyl-8-ribityllumazine synthase [Dehalococcoidales bacterium]MDD4322921.1 6,7-dimethyl-8-ribityllumazine synthase [Dehalococcoidales bacterium]MDD4794656.1 6,7-dimethyl-8-ribityllumazine synthase [Dehalococcoidales bacterium]MDD5499093.1 6,7-dimethyl-8-ribityllumazine synthase [Dehalococcoidales bacterium]MDX9803812.1 6,7-dimethyl-8-ribityllumazine synthase [Dehalococcoidales bacterium]
MGKSFEGNLDGSGLKIALVVSRFNEFITTKLLDGAVDGLVRHKVSKEDIDVAWTPGALEISLAAQNLARKGGYDAIICLGAVIRGGTPHFDYVATELSKGVAKVSLDSGIPVINGVITSDNLEQAIERAGSKMGNKGFAAASSAIEMANLIKAMG